MSRDISGKRVRSKRVRYDGGARKEKVEEEVHIDEGTDSVTRSQEATPHPVVQRELIIHRHILIAAAVCLSLLCVLLVLRTTDMALNSMHCQSDNDELQTNYINLQTNYSNLQTNYSNLQTNYNNLTLDRNNLQNNFDKLIKALEHEVNQLKTEKAGKVCPSDWKAFGCSCYYRSTENKTWEESRAQCRKTVGADLVVIDSNEEKKFINELSMSGTSWIGLIWIEGDGHWNVLTRTEGYWVWMDGTKVTIRAWTSGNNGHCAAYQHHQSSVTWIKELCSQETFWICEMKNGWFKS